MDNNKVGIQICTNPLIDRGSAKKDTFIKKEMESDINEG